MNTRFRRWLHHLRVLTRPRAPKPKPKVDNPFRRVRWFDPPAKSNSPSLQRRFQSWSILLRKKSLPKEKKPSILIHSIKRPLTLPRPRLKQRLQRFWKQTVFFFKATPKTKPASGAGAGFTLNMWLSFKKDARNLVSPVGIKRVGIWAFAVISIVVVTLAMVEGILQLSSIVCWTVVQMEPVVAPDPERFILCAGDSFTAGKFSATSIQPYSFYLEKTLNRSSATQWRVLNFSSEYFRSDDLIRGIARTLQLQRPSLVYVSVGMNDFSRPPKVEETTNFEEAPFPRTKFFLQSWKGLRSYSSMIEVVAIPPQFLLHRTSAPELPFSEGQFSKWRNASQKQSPGGSRELTAFMTRDVQVAWHQLIAGDFKNAEGSFRELMKKNPADPFVHAALAELHYRYGLNEQAEHEIEWLRLQFENHGDIRWGMALLHAFPFENSTYETLELITKMMDRFPVSSLLWESLARNCALMGENNVAKQAMQRALDLIPSTDAKEKAVAERAYAAIIAQSDPGLALQELAAADRLDPDDAAFQSAVSELSPYFQSTKIDSVFNRSEINEEQRTRLRRLYAECMDKSYARSAFLFERHLIRLFELCRKYHAQPVLVSYPLTRPYVDTVFGLVSEKTGTPWMNLSVNFESMLQDTIQRRKMMYKGNLTEEASRWIGQWLASDAVYRFKKFTN